MTRYIILSALAGFFIAPQLPETELRWDWSTIDTSATQFPKDFKWGIALSEYQNSGEQACPTCNWADWEKCCDSSGRPRIEGGERSGSAANFWDTFSADIKRMKNLGINTCSISVAWSRIEPREGVFDAVAIAHYHKVFNALHKAGIQPFVSIHHFTHPDWFEAKGAFENEENIEYLVRFAKKLFTEYSDTVKLWCTILEPGVYAFQGYFRGVWPPGKTGHLRLMGIVIKNLLKAHTAVYKALKALPGGQQAQIGISHSVTQFDPYHPWNPIEHGVTTFMNHIFHGAITYYFKTGEFRWNVPGLGLRVTHTDYDAPNTLDYFGLNYYSHVLIGMRPQLQVIDQMYRADDIKTDMPYSIYAEGLYRAIADVAGIGKPIIITENGVSMSNEQDRTLYVQRYLYALSKAIADGYDIRGYFHWTLTDNFEWDMGYSQRFGLYGVDFKTKKRTLRDSGRYYKQVIAAS